MSTIGPSSCLRPPSPTWRRIDSRLLSHSGFSLVEVVTVIAIMAVIATFSAPTFIEWQQNLRYKQSASEIANSLKTARSKSISLNKQHGLKFVTANRSYQFCRYSSNNQWVYYGTTEVLANRVVLDLNGTAASAVAPAPNIRFNYNGSSFDNYSVRIKDTNNTSKYTVSVDRSGRIKMTKK